MRDVPKNEVHHWWPRSLSNFWKDESGNAHRIESTGELLRSAPKSFGGIRNDNNIVFRDTPSSWDTSFERSFAKADDGFPWLIERLQMLGCPIKARKGIFATRLASVRLEPEWLDMLSECMASLIARSPSFRDRVSKTAEYYRNQLGFKDPKPDKALIASSVHNAQNVFSNVLRSGGKFVVLLADLEEFIFGDGFLHSFSSLDPPLNPRCLIPLTPKIAIFYALPSLYRTEPKILIANLIPEEVTFINRTVQIYSARYLFFRSAHPVIEDAFRKSVHLEFQYHKHPWVDELEAAAASYIAPTSARSRPPS